MRTWLKAIRLQQEKTQQQVALMAGIRQPAYCNIENGRRSPRPAIARKIARTLGFVWTRFYDED